MVEEFCAESSCYISSYIPTGVIIQTLLISKNDTSSVVLPGSLFEELILCIALEAGPSISILFSLSINTVLYY